MKSLSDVNWSRRKAELPSLVETFRLIREICAGNSSFLGTCVTSLEMIRVEIQQIRITQSRIEDTTDALAKRVMLMNETLTTFLGAANDETSPGNLPTD